VNVGTWYGLQKTSGMTFSKTGFVSGKSILPVPKAGIGFNTFNEARSYAKDFL